MPNSGTALQKQLDREALSVYPSVHDLLAVDVADAIGFDAIYMTEVVITLISYNHRQHEPNPATIPLEWNYSS